MKTDAEWLQAYKILSAFPPAVVDLIVPQLTQEELNNLMRVGSRHMFKEWYAGYLERKRATDYGSAAND